MDLSKTDKLMKGALRKVKGLKGSCPLLDEDRQQILAKEQEAEERSLMGLGKVINTGVREVLNGDLVYVALTTMDFDWGYKATLILKKDQEVVGEEVRNKAMIAELSEKENVWFLHKNFVVYKDKISFPQDIMKKICFFEIPCLPADFFILDTDDFQYQSVFYGNPSTLCDIYLKEKYFAGIDEKGLGTILVGVTL